MIVRKSSNADSRSAEGKLNINDLERDTKSHINDVKKGLDFISFQIKSRGSDHDRTKLENMNEFYNALVSGNVKETSWYKKHITEERHHLKSNVPDNVNLIDVIEHIVDCTMAGLTRSGEIYDTDINPETLELAVKNTVELLKDNIRVIQDNIYKEYKIPSLIDIIEASMSYGILSIPEICVENIYTHKKINVGITLEELSGLINGHGKKYAEKILIEKCKEVIDAFIIY